MALDEFDVVVIGAGPAGCVVGRRLADAGLAVGLFEAGPGAKPAGVVSWDATQAEQHPEWFWPGLTAQSGANTKVRYRAGRGVGGGSAVNYMVLSAGDRVDYRRWDQAWHGGGYEPVAHVVDALVATIEPVAVQYGRLAVAVAEAAGRDGHKVSPPLPGTVTTAPGEVLGSTSPADPSRRSRTGLGPDALGFVPVLLGGAGGRRRSAAEIFLVDSPRNLVVHPNTEVSEVIVSPGRRVRGVVVHGVNGTREVKAKTVVLCAGAIHSPRLLVRSGLVPPGLRLAVSDHPSFVFTAELKADGGRSRSEAQPAVTAMLRWSRSRSSGGPLTALIVDHVAQDGGRASYGAVIMMLDRPRSVGYVSVDQNARVDIVPGWLSHSADCADMVAGFRYLAGLLQSDSIVGDSSPVARLLVDDSGTTLDTLCGWDDDAVAGWLGAHPGPVTHLVGSCAGLIDWPTAQLSGVVGLHIVDGSVLAGVPSGPPQLPIMVMADRVAATLAATLTGGSRKQD